MSILRLLIFPFVLLFRILLRPLKIRGRRRASGRDGWIELELEGPVVELYAAPKISFLRRFLPSGDEPSRVVLSNVKRLVDAAIGDPSVKGVLVRIGGLGGGWAASVKLRSEIARLRAAGKTVLVHVKHGALNREYLVATAAEKILAMPSAMIAPVGSASATLFWRDALEKVGVRFEVAAAGRYKSAPESLTRNERSENDREQTQALIDAFDRSLLQAIAEGRKVTEAEAAAMVDAAPLTGPRALAAKLVDGLVRDEDLPVVAGSAKEPIQPVTAGDYYRRRVLQPLIERNKRSVGIVEVHGPIMDRGGMTLGYLEKLAIEKAVVADLRTALAEPHVGAVVLHVDSRGGSVLASDAIYGAVKRLAEDKPVIACFADVAASGGYYVACGAQAIVASPLTITGSIGVFATLPTWPGITERFEIHQDIIKNRRNAALFDPWRPRSDEERAHTQAEVESMYDSFLELVAAARKKTKAEADQVAQGRVWTGEEAFACGLLDGLGGLEEAIDRAKTAAKGRFRDQPLIVRAHRPMPRPDPHLDDAARKLLATFAFGPLKDEVAAELLVLSLAAPNVGCLAYAPISLT